MHWKEPMSVRSPDTTKMSLLLYKAFFSRDYDLFQPRGPYAAVQSPTGAWYPSAADALPFFTEYFRQAQALGMRSYETDFMSDHLLPTPALSSEKRALGP